MSDKDYVIQSTINIPFGAVIAQKPSYLVKLAPEGKKSATAKLFFAIEQPKFETSYIQVKGFFYEGEEESVYKQYNEIVSQSDRATYVEMWFPWHSIVFVRSLVFKADKAKK